MLHVSLYLQYHVSQIIMFYHILDVHNSCHLVMLQRNAKIETSIRGFHIQKYIAPQVEDTNEYETSEMRSGMCNPANPPYYLKHTKTQKCFVWNKAVTGALFTPRWYLQFDGTNSL